MIFFIAAAFFINCSDTKQPVQKDPVQVSDTVITPVRDTGITKTISPKLNAGKITTGSTSPSELLLFAKTLIGTPYLYASTDPAKGFDCSGFITYVFNHFKIAVPRSSVDFTYMGKEINPANAKPGDLILFTGTDTTIRIVGHMGIVERNEQNKLQFIHSTSGKAKGVVITPLEKYYYSRLVKIIRVFPDHFFN